MTQHKTRRGELMAKLEAKKIGAGHYAIRGFEAKMIREASGSRPGLWIMTHAERDAVEVPHLTAALELINGAPAEIETETASTEVEIVDATPAPVAPEVPAEPVVAEVQEEVVVEIVSVPSPRKPTTRKPKSRRAQLLAELGAREISTAEYEVAGHQVMYVAPGVMPRNAGGRWRTTLMTATGVITNWNLSLTAALEVVAERVRGAGAPVVRTSGARRYVAVYPFVHVDVDLCELHADGCADLGRASHAGSPQVAVVLDITDEAGMMNVLDPDRLGYDVHSVKVMPCAQHAPLVENVDA